VRRVWGLVYRHLALYRRSWPRVVELAYWPTLELLIWGFTSAYFSQAHGGAAGGPAGGPAVMAGGALIGGVLLW
jgi:ABC-2 type transport system permease protein